jgi:zinc-ribbon family
LLLIWGLRVFYRTIGQGTFHCRKCGGDRQYRHRAGRRFFTLFFIPVIPLNRTGEHVQCLTCKTRYVTGVLGLPTVAQMQAALPAGMRAAATVMLVAGDRGSTAARQRAVAAIQEAGAQDYTDAHLDPDAAQPAEAIGAALSQVARQLTPDAKEWFLAEIVRIGMADGLLTDSERRVTEVIAMNLGMTQAQAVGVVTMAERSAQQN